MACLWDDRGIGQRPHLDSYEHYMEVIFDLRKLLGSGLMPAFGGLLFPGEVAPHNFEKIVKVGWTNEFVEGKDIWVAHRMVVFFSRLEMIPFVGRLNESTGKPIADQRWITSGPMLHQFRTNFGAVWGQSAIWGAGVHIY